MAVTTVLVSFSCTGPIVGALLVEAMGKFALKPILGMAVFGLAFSLPFTFFAIFPSTLSKLPKSGGWLNEIKVVLGILILAFGIKFLINIDQTYHWDIISREFVLTFWIVLSLFLGMYLLGKIRMLHDTPVERTGVFRLLLALTFTLQFTCLPVLLAEIPYIRWLLFCPFRNNWFTRCQKNSCLLP